MRACTVSADTTNVSRLYTVMTFSESQHPRATDGTFTNKVGSAAEVSLDSPFPEGFPTEGTMQEKVDWALANDAALTVSVGDYTVENELSGEQLQQSWKLAEQFHVDLKVSAVHLPEPFSQEIGRVASRLQNEALDEERVTLDDISVLRAAANRAEYRLVEYEAENFLAEHHPEARGLLVSFDRFSGEPYLVGIETSLPEPDSGRNYGTVNPLSGEYEDISDWEGQFSYCLQRFENEGLFDEYGTVLTDDNDKWGEFVDPGKGTEDSLGLQDSARVYRFGERY